MGSGHIIILALRSLFIFGTFSRRKETYFVLRALKYSDLLKYKAVPYENIIQISKGIYMLIAEAVSSIITCRE